MPAPGNPTKAIIQEINWSSDGRLEEGTKRTVQFNPESLKLTFSNQISTESQKDKAALQFSGRGTTKLAFDLWFDVSAPQPDGRQENDVRKLTRELATFLEPKEQEEGQAPKLIPPGIRFLWGSFLFEGIMESMNESLEYFSEEGRPLRASVSVSLVKQDVAVQIRDLEQPGSGDARPGTRPMERARAGESVQDVASRQGRPDAWPRIAEANDVDNPRRLAPGTPLDTRVA